MRIDNIIPKNGDKRTIIKFAWLPVQINDSVKVWLEAYRENQIYCPYPYQHIAWHWQTRELINE